MHNRLDQDERRFRRVVDGGKHYLISDEYYSIWKKGKLDLRKSGHRKIKDEPFTGNSNAESSDINH